MPQTGNSVVRKCPAPAEPTCSNAAQELRPSFSCPPRAILRGFMAVGKELRAFATSAYAGKGRKTFCRTCSAV